MKNLIFKIALISCFYYADCMQAQTITLSASTFVTNDPVTVTIAGGVAGATYNITLRNTVTAPTCISAMGSITVDASGAGTGMLTIPATWLANASGQTCATLGGTTVGTGRGIRAQAVAPATGGANSTAITINSPLPIKLSSFDVTLKDKSVVALWTTFTEINNDHFTIERSNSGRQWTSVGKVQSKGNSSKEVNYTFVDKNPGSGLNYYRLVQMDIDGQTTYFDEKSIEVAAGKTDLFFNGSELILVNGNNQGKLRIIDMNGRIIMEKSLDSDNVFIDELPSGTYFFWCARPSV